jgi:hypothetical protein
MKKHLFPALAIVTAIFGISRTAHAADEFFIFKVSVTAPLKYVIQGTSTDKVVTKSLSANDFVNLSLGRPLGSPVDKEKEIPVLGFTFSGSLDADQRPTSPPLVKLMIYDKTATGAARKVQEVATLTSIDYQKAFAGAGGKGIGICAGTINETPAVVPAPGDPTKNKIFAANFTGAAMVTQGPGGFNTVESFALSVTSMTARLKILLTDKNGVTAPIDGYILKGAFKTAGKRIDTYQE